MTVQRNADIMCKRILSIPLTGDELDDEFFDLMREYVRRVALGQQALKVTQTRPFFDIAEKINPKIRADSEMLNGLHEHFRDVPNPWMQRIGEWALHFATLQDSLVTYCFNLPAPYEPLIVLFERGGTFTIKHEGILLNGGTMSIRDWQEQTSSTPIIRLDG